MNFITALYGGQYKSLHDKGFDVQKGRFYGNLMLTAIILIYLFITFIILNFISEDILDDLLKPLRKLVGRSMGKAMSQLVVMPLLALIYFIVALLFGSKKSYQKSYEKFSSATQEQQTKASEKLIGIFIIGLLLLVVLAIASLFF